MRDMVDNLIEVNKINGFSQIHYNWYLYKKNISEWNVKKQFIKDYNLLMFIDNLLIYESFIF